MRNYAFRTNVRFHPLLDTLVRGQRSSRPCTTFIRDLPVVWYPRRPTPIGYRRPIFFHLAVAVRSPLFLCFSDWRRGFSFFRIRTVAFHCTNGHARSRYPFAISTTFLHPDREFSVFERRRVTVRAMSYIVFIYNNGVTRRGDISRFGITPLMTTDPYSFAAVAAAEDGTSSLNFACSPIALKNVRTTTTDKT